MKLSDKDKKLISFILGLVMIFCAYFFGFRNLTAKSSELDEVIKEDTEYYNTLKGMVDMEATYIADTETFQAGYLDILNKFDTGITQEHSILFISEMERKTGAWVSQAIIGESNSVYQFGQGASSNPLRPDDRAYSSDYVGNEAMLTLNYEAPYPEFKQLIDYINTFDSKCKISSLNAAYDDEGFVSGTLLMSQYAITGSDRVFLDAPITNMYNGTENIFDSSTFEPNDDDNIEDLGLHILTDYDYYIALKPHNAAGDAVVIGPKGDRNGVQSISVNTSEVVDLTIMFDKNSEGKYVVSYKVGDVAYPVVDYDKGVEFVPGGRLSLRVMSADRNLIGEDENGVKATIINTTDMQLEIKIDDDKNNPRFTIADKVGDIKIYE